MVEIAPSMLGANFGEMKKEAMLVAPHSSYLHMDVMDGHFVPNLTMGPDLVKALKGIEDIDVHLMVSNPTDFIQDFSDVGADIISVHVEANNPAKAIKLIKELNIKAGIALNPSTPSSAIEPYIEVTKFLEKEFPNIELNAGHDLNLDNLDFILKKIPEIKEVSIGHALVCDAIDYGLKETISKYKQIAQR